MLRNSVYRGKFNIEVLELTFGLEEFYLVLRLNGVDCVYYFSIAAVRDDVIT